MGVNLGGVGWGELQWILNEDFSLYSFHTVLTVTLNAFIQSARADLKAVPVILTFLLSFRWLLLLLFQFPQQWGVFDIQQRPCVLAGPSVFSAIVPVFPEHGRAVVIFFKFSCILISPSSVFFFFSVTQWKPVMLQPLLAGLILMLLLLLPASICVFAAVTFIPYLSKNWSWACCSRSAEPQRWVGGLCLWGRAGVLGGGCRWSTQEWEFWEFSAFKQLADRQAGKQQQQQLEDTDWVSRSWKILEQMQAACIFVSYSSHE